MRVEDAVNIDDLRERARRRLPRIIFDYLDGGAEDEVTLARNRAAFERWAFVPRILPGIPAVDTSSTLFGDTLRVPWVIGPSGLNGIFHSGADIAIARAAARAGAVYAHPTLANVDLDEAARAAGARWFQLYPWGERSVWQRLLERARNAGHRALIVTVDTLVTGNRERDRRHGFSHQVRYTPRALLDGLTHPRWLFDVWFRSGTTRLANMAEFAAPGASATAIAGHVRTMRNPGLSWDDLAFIREHWDGPLLIKGVLSPEDALRAAEFGAAGVVISNHGGRQLDGAIATLDALPPIVAAVGTRMTIVVDGGFRRGSDIVKALALGAHAVMLGRAPLYGVAAAGEAGVDRALAILTQEMIRVLHLLGCRNLAALSGAHLRDLRPLGPG